MKNKTVGFHDIKPGQIFEPVNNGRRGYIALFRQGSSLVTARTDHAKKMLDRRDAPLNFYTWKDKGGSFVIVGKSTPTTVKKLTECHTRLEKKQAQYVEENHKKLDIDWTPGGATVKMKNGQTVKAGQFAYVHFSNGDFKCLIGNLKGVLWNKEFEVAVMPLRYGEIDEHRKHAIFVRPDRVLYRIVKDEKGSWTDKFEPEPEEPEKPKVEMPKLTQEQKDRIYRAMYETWQQIGSDVIQSMEENEHRSYVTKDEFIEVVTDANYMETYSRDTEACKLVDELFKADYDGAYKVLRKLFKYERFG